MSINIISMILIYLLQLKKEILPILTFNCLGTVFNNLFKCQVHSFQIFYSDSI